MKNNGRWKKIVKTLFARKVAMVSAVVVVLFIAVAILAPVISPYDPNYADFASFLQGPGSAHLLGTDNYGRDANFSIEVEPTMLMEPLKSAAA